MATLNIQPKGAYSVPEFCSTFGGFGRPHFYNLLKLGKGPRIFKVGKRTLISHEAAHEWVRRMEMETMQESENTYRISLPKFGKGWTAYEAAKRWLIDTHPELSNIEREKLHLLAAKMAGV